MRFLSGALALVALFSLGCPASEVSEPAPQESAELGADALAVRALVAEYVERAPEEIDWDAKLASYGLDELDASELLMIVEEELGLEIREQDVEVLTGDAAVNGLHQRLTTRTLAKLARDARWTRDGRPM
jgi:acyl carrier protein